MAKFPTYEEMAVFQLSAIAIILADISSNLAIIADKEVKE